MKKEFSHFTIVYGINQDTRTGYFDILDNDGRFIASICEKTLTGRQLNAFMSGTEDEVVNAINVYVQEQLRYAYKLAAKFNLEI